jgi:hypothetical protein
MQQVISSPNKNLWGFLLTYSFKKHHIQNGNYGARKVLVDVKSIPDSHFRVILSVSNSRTSLSFHTTHPSNNLLPVKFALLRILVRIQFQNTSTRFQQLSN